LDFGFWIWDFWFGFFGCCFLNLIYSIFGISSLGFSILDFGGSPGFVGGTRGLATSSFSLNNVKNPCGQSQIEKSRNPFKQSLIGGLLKFV
jgi:hypothetical protein